MNKPKPTSVTIEVSIRVKSREHNGYNDIVVSNVNEERTFTLQGDIGNCNDVIAATVDRAQTRTIEAISDHDDIIRRINQPEVKETEVEF